MPNPRLSFRTRRLLSVATQILLTSTAFSAAPLPQSTKPPLHVENDGFPSGHDTPEGIASDLARAFIDRDEKRFAKTCVRSHGRGQSSEAYESFLKEMTQVIRDEATRKKPSPTLPSRISKVFAARHLTKNGPASFGYAAFDFEDIMFVDVGVYLHNGERALNRTMVIKDRDGKWYVHPAPNLDPLLSDGLNQETDSSVDFADVYNLHK
jgi:hypothetical protein